MDIERIRMELYKEVYLQWSPKVMDHTGNIAETMAKNAVNSFDRKFKEDQSEQVIMKTHNIQIDTELVGVPVEVEIKFEHQPLMEDCNCMWAKEEFTFISIMMNGINITELFDKKLDKQALEEAIVNKWRSDDEL